VKERADEHLTEYAAREKKREPRRDQQVKERADEHLTEYAAREKPIGQDL
jgi:hypothetical protein